MNHSAAIEQSLNKAHWRLPDIDLGAVEKIVRGHNVPEIVARLLCARGIAGDDIQDFLHPTLKKNFPDPFSLRGMNDLADFMAQAITDKRPMAVFGDFDVDGATSSAILHRFLKHYGIDAPIYIPQRLTEGYGPNEEALKKLKEQGAEIVFLLDCGTTAFETVAAGAALGLEIIIIDHHEAEDSLPEAAHVINPKRKDDVSGLDMLAAVGVVFLTCVAINNRLKGDAPLKEWLDVVALGTVCDMVPLVGPNRLFTRFGFQLMNNTSNTGLQNLVKVSGISGDLSPYHAGFVLGPRINAGSRVHKSDLGATLLSTDDAEEAHNIAWTLNDCNDKRKTIQQEMERKAIEMVEAKGMDNQPLIFVADESFHQGLSGLVAGRLKEKYGKPACVVSFTEDGEGRGSGRSVPGIHIAQAFIDARNADIIAKGGGHAMAGGFSVAGDKIEAFEAFLQEHIAGQMSSGAVNVETDIDAILTVRGARVEFIKMVHEHVGPFGQEFPEPLFLLQNVRIHSADVVGDAHIRCQVSDWEGGTRMKAMAFRAVGTDLGDALLKQGKSAFDLAGHLKVDNWGGTEKVEMHIKDGRVAV